jgi:hypothetical protein
LSFSLRVAVFVVIPGKIPYDLCGFFVKFMFRILKAKGKKAIIRLKTEDS